MRRSWTEPRNRPYLVAAIILLAGLISAAVIYLSAGPASGTLMEFSADSSKKYLRDLELYGGIANVLAVELMDWIDGLWHGKRLAATVIAITLAVCLGYLFFAVRLPHSTGEDSPEDDHSV